VSLWWRANGTNLPFIDSHRHAAARRTVHVSIASAVPLMSQPQPPQQQQQQQLPAAPGGVPPRRSAGVAPRSDADVPTDTDTAAAVTKLIESDLAVGTVMETESIQPPLYQLPAGLEWRFGGRSVISSQSSPQHAHAQRDDALARSRSRRIADS
jgi:hypothetical protein